ncbi:MAG: FAD-dependent oxidoreductase [Nanoarchaeota archaeon]|nr:FAD-dependent oxidoreductase [Nanoarchaeota archaeon]
MEDIYDVLILGGGPAGLTAGIYCGRYNMKTLVVAGKFGGTANLAGELENWPGFSGSGMELMGEIKNQAEKFGCHFLEGDITKVEKLTSWKGSATPEGLTFGGRAHASYGGLAGFELTVDNKIIFGKSLIVALGTEHRQLNIPGEKKFLGKGVSYCATCDGNFFKGKSVAVVGGADSAAKAALYLAGICEKVYVVYRKHEMRCEPISLSNICSTSNIDIMYYSEPTEIVGENKVTGLKIKSEDSGDVEIDVDGVFIEVGATPAVDVLKDLGLVFEKNYIVTGKDGKTNVDGVFAAGDVTNGPMKQMVTAAGEGAIVAKMAHEFLLGKNS